MSEDGRNLRTLDFTVGFYSGARYQPEFVKRVFESVLPHLESGALRCSFQNIPIATLTFSMVSELELGAGKKSVLEPNDPQLHTLLQTMFVERIQAKHHRTGREVTISPWISTDDTAVIEVQISLYDREEQASMSRIVDATWREVPLVEMFDKVDCLWGSLEVAGPTPTLGPVRSGQESLPYCGYWGSELVNIVGRRRVGDSLRPCPKVVACPNGGFFLCWDWDGKKPTKIRGFNEFREVVTSAVRLLHST